MHASPQRPQLTRQRSRYDPTLLFRAENDRLAASFACTRSNSSWPTTAGIAPTSIHSSLRHRLGRPVGPPDRVGRRAADPGVAVSGPAGVDPPGVGRVPQDPAHRGVAPARLARGRGDAQFAEVVDQPVQGAAALGVPGEHLGDDGRLGRVEVDPRGVAGPVGRHPVAVGGAGPGEHLAGPEAALPAAPRALGDQGPLVLGDGPADLEQELVVRVLGHRAVEELDAAALGLQLLEQEDLVDVVAGQPVGVGQEDRVEGGHGRRVAEAVEAGPLERGAAVAVVTEDVRLGELPSPGPRAWSRSRSICWSMVCASACRWVETRT